MPGRTFGRACVALALALSVPGPACSTAILTVLELPAGVVADNATEMAVLCSLTNGYPNNLYAVKGTFSPGELPYYGVTYNPGTTQWAGQIDAWSTTQRRIQTDDRGAWRGYLYVRLEDAAPRGTMLFRFSAVPLSPVSLPGPTVSDWYSILSLDRESTAGWLCGHVFRDPEATIPAQGVIVRAEDVFGRLLGAYASQDAFVMDGEDRTDLGFVRLGLPIGTATKITGRTRNAGPDGPAGTAVLLYLRGAGPWRVQAGQSVSLDASVWGDADGDGALTLSDVIETIRACAGFTSLDGDSAHRADVWPTDPDGRVSVQDALTLLRHLASVQSTVQKTNRSASRSS